MKRCQLVDACKDLSDTSFTVPDPGSRYTAWSSMGTLVKKGFVIKESSPAKYSLTDAGCEMAHKLLNTAFSPKDTSDAPQRFTFGVDSPVKNRSPARPQRTTEKSPSRKQSPRKRLPSFEPAIDLQSYVSPKKKDISKCTADQEKSGLSWVYVTQEGMFTPTKDHAEVLIDDELGIGFLAKCVYQELITSQIRYKMDHSRASRGGEVFAYIHNGDAPDHFITPVSSRTSSNISSAHASKKPASATSHTNILPSNKMDEGIPLAKRLLLSNDTIKPSGISTLSSPVIDITCDEVPHSNQTTETDSQSSTCSTSTAGGGLLTDSQNSVRSLSCMSSIQSVVQPKFILRPGAFDIVLCVDNAEHYGAGAHKQNLLPDLIKNGVDCEVRKLQVGDFLWVARERVRPIPGQLALPSSRELVLDYIVERKRMDDLASSIIDGRFKEQKFRLKHCGLKKPIYLIEEYGSSQNLSIKEDTLNQSIVNTQVIDGFFVKRTRDIKESVAYLTIMTRYLQSLYKTKTLGACSREEMDNGCRGNNDEQLLLTFTECNNAAVKSKAMSVREMFGKQLVQLGGMSADKAVSVLERYSTPQALYAAYQSCSATKDKETLIASLKYGKTNRSIGPLISRQVYQLYNTATLT